MATSFKSSSPARRVVLLLVPPFQLFDLAGPMEVLAGANQWALSEGRQPVYHLEVVSTDNKIAPSSVGLSVVAQAPLPLPAPADTLLVVGGPGILNACGEPAMLEWLRESATQARRVTSVCNGAFLLAAAGLLNGRRATTHWAYCDRLAKQHPQVEVCANEIFVRDGPTWTSAGVTAGADLSLALVEEDLGRRAALTIARWLVLFVKRPGGQSQFSTQLALQTVDETPLQDLQDWISDHLEEDLSVLNLAQRASMSPRHFARIFKRDLGKTPARYVEELRLEAARTLLEETTLGVKAIAARCGLGTAESLRRLFLRHLAVSPAAYRRRFRTTTHSAHEKSPGAKYA